MGGDAEVDEELDALIDARLGIRKRAGLEETLSTLMAQATNEARQDALAQVLEDPHVMEVRAALRVLAPVFGGVLDRLQGLADQVQKHHDAALELAGRVGVVAAGLDSRFDELASARADTERLRAALAETASSLEASVAEFTRTSQLPRVRIPERDNLGRVVRVIDEVRP